MCEILLRVVDKTSPDPLKDVGLTKRGDVIVVVEDGHQWGTGDLSNPHWRIIKLPNVPLSVGLNFLAPEIGDDPSFLDPMLQKRGIKFDLEHVLLTQPLKAWLADDTRAQPTWTSNLMPAQFTSMKIKKPKRPHPDIL